MTQFKFKKRYGQNFLKNTSIIEKIASTISPSKDDLIIEIGPGGGVITRELKKHGCNLLAFEIDEETKKFLNPLEDDKTKIIYKDFLTVDLKDFIKDYKYDKIYIVGNLPYYITTPIIEHIIDSGVAFTSLTVMVQKEVADRFLANPRSKDYGYMTVLLKYNFDIEKVVDVKREYFEPVPKVDSTVIKLSSHTKEDIDYEKFKNLLKEAFQFKRKTIYNNLKRYDRERLESILRDHGFSLQNRAEEIDLNTFIDLSKNL